MVGGRIKKVFIAALAVILVSLFPVTALAADIVLASGVDGSGAGWDWDGSTLVLDGFDSMLEGYGGINLPDGAVISLKPGSVNNVSDGVYGMGGLTIAGNGELNVTGNRFNPEIGFFMPAVFSVGALELAGCNVLAQGSFGIGTSDGGIRILNSRVDAQGIVGIFSDFDSLPSGPGAEYGVEIVNSSVRSWGLVPILGSEISMSGCQIIEPAGAHVGSFDPLGTAILDSQGNPYIQYVEIGNTLPEKPHTISYHPNGAVGTAPLDMKLYYRGDKVTLPEGEGMSWPGYDFVGWELADGTPVTEPFLMGDKDVTLFATWKAK